MAIVDTNVLMRLITGDVPELAERASEIIKTYHDNKVTVPDYVMAEIAFVLQFQPMYRWPRRDIYLAFLDLLATPQLRFSSISKNAVNYFNHYPKLDFTDCLLLAQAKSEQVDLVTFDKDLAKTIAQF